MSFDSLGLAEPILRAVAAEGYQIPTPIQAQAIPHVLAGRDLLGCAQTGTGKTAAFALPILHRLTHAGNPPRGRGRRVRVLTLAPTRELASQIGESFRTYGRNSALKHTVLFGGVGYQPQIRDLRHGVDILVATPGRLVDLMNQGVVDLHSVETFVLDEADRMLDMGFLPDLRRVIAKLPTQRQTVFFSATMPEAIAQLAAQILKSPVEVRVAPVKVTTDLIEQSVCFVNKQHKSGLLARFLAGRGVSRAIVFTRTKRGADRVAEQLGKSGVRAEAMHGNKSQAHRERALASFRSSRTQVLVATDLAARGLDVDGISHIFNYDLPVEPETYVHRIGRTGRAGATGAAVSFCADDEHEHLRAIEHLLRQTLVVDPDSPGARPARSSSPERSKRPAFQGGRPHRKTGSRPKGSARPRRPYKGNGPRKGRKHRPATAGV
jgi:ATP-dependent RNA helicase RhlE